MRILKKSDKDLIVQFNQIRSEKNYSYKKIEMLSHIPKTTLSSISTLSHRPTAKTKIKLELFVLRNQK